MEHKNLNIPDRKLDQPVIKFYAEITSDHKK